MEQPFPPCVRAAWDSAPGAPQPEARPDESREDSGPWPLPLGPTLGDLSWLGGPEPRSAPCGLLREACALHRPRAHGCWGRSAGPPAARSPTPWPRPEPPGEPCPDLGRSLLCLLDLDASEDDRGGLSPASPPASPRPPPARPPQLRSGAHRAPARPAPATPPPPPPPPRRPPPAPPRLLRPPSAPPSPWSIASCWTSACLSRHA